MNHEKIIQSLKQGNERFQKGESDKSSQLSLEKLKKLAKEGQKPKAIILSCSDSRAPAEMIFDQDIGDLFVIRVAGNIVAPSLIGSVEFAVSTFGTRVVVVMGHSKCGAIDSTLTYIENPQAISSENIHDIIGRIKPHIYQIAQLPELDKKEKTSRAVEANVMASVAQLSSSSRIIEDFVDKEELKILGAVFDIDTGAVTFLDNG